jgi:hypothetical protein
VALDSCRGICALLVAIYHFNGNSHLYDSPFVRHAWLFVDFFFVLSGFVITHAYGSMLESGRDIGPFMLRRFGRLWPLHVTVLAAFIGLELMKLLAAAALGVGADNPPFASRGGFSIESIPTNILLIHALGMHQSLTWNSPSWSISTELWTYLVFACICVISPKRPPSVFVVGIIGAAAATVVWRFSHHYMDTTYDYGIYRCIYGFLVGHLIYRLGRPAMPAWMESIFEAAILLLVFGFVRAAGDSVFSIGAPIVFGLSVWVFAGARGPVSVVLTMRPFIHLGTWSYSLYMVHRFVLAIINRIFDLIAKMGAFGTESGFVEMRFPWEEAPIKFMRAENAWIMEGVLIAYLVAVVLLSSVTYRFIEATGRRFFNELAARFDRTVQLRPLARSSLKEGD